MKRKKREKEREMERGWSGERKERETKKDIEGERASKREKEWSTSSNNLVMIDGLPRP